MRIIGGKYRGLKLAEFAGGDIRPTADRVKESLFNILGNLSGASVLDLFCGSGNLGIESISRGAAFVHFNDISRESLAVLNKNLAKVKLKDGSGYKITNLDFPLCLSAAKPFDIIFIDPPYRLEAGVSALKIIGKNRLLSEDGIAVYERDKSFSGEIAGLEKFDERKYGKTFLTFFKNA